MASYCDPESDEISEEILLLQAIYVHELKLEGPEERPTVVNLFLHPSTGNDDHNSKYVCLNLSLLIPDEYPFQCPGISIKYPRGLSDAHVTSIQENLIALAKEKIGSAMLYDLIEYAKECLSDNNIPSCPCVICLEHFQGEEKFLKTECYHYFHSVCLGNYVDHFLSENENKKIVCPMCRLEIKYNKNEYKENDSCSSTEEIFVYKPDEEQRKAQAERQKIFEYQKQKGGIINIEEERTKYLIGIKDGTGDESSDVQADRISETSVKETLGTKELLPENESKNEFPNFKNCDVASDKEEQNNNRKGGEASKNISRKSDTGRKYTDTNKTRGPVAEAQRKGSENQSRVRDCRPSTRNKDNERKTPFTGTDDSVVRQSKNTLTEQGKFRQARKNIRETNTPRRGNDGESKENSSEIKKPVCTGNEYKSEPLEFGKNSESQRRSPQSLTGHYCDKKYSRIVDEGVNRQRNSRNSPSPRDDWSGNSRNPQDQRRDQCWEKKIGPRNREMARNDRYFNSRKKERGRQEKSEVVESLKQETTKGDSSPKESKDKHLTNELKSLTIASDPSKQVGIAKPCKKPQSKNEDISGNARNVAINDISTLKQISKKQSSQTDKRQNQRRASTPRRDQVAGKDYKRNDGKNAQRTYSSATLVTNQHVQRTKKHDSPVSENFEKFKSNSNISRTESKASSNSGDDVAAVNSMNDESLQRNKHPTRNPPPGFENGEQDESITEKVGNKQMFLPRQSVEIASNSDVKTNKSLLRKPPPGFENVQPNTKK